MDRPEIILAPGPTPIPPEVLLAQGSPLVYHRGPGFGESDARGHRPPEDAVPHRAADVLLMTSSGTGGLESAVQNCSRPATRCFVPLAGFFAERFKRLAESHGLVVHTLDDEWGTRIDPAKVADALAEHPGEGRAADAERDVHRRDPADRAARARRERRRRDGGRRRRLQPRRRAVRLRRVGHRRGGGRLAEGASARARASRSWRSATRAWEASPDRHLPPVLLRLGDLQAVRRAAGSREPVDAGDQRDAGAAGGARAVLPGRGRRRDGAAPDALAGP